MRRVLLTVLVLAVLCGYAQAIPDLRVFMGPETSGNNLNNNFDRQNPEFSLSRISKGVMVNAAINNSIDRYDGNYMFDRVDPQSWRNGSDSFSLNADTKNMLQVLNNVNKNSGGTLGEISPINRTSIAPLSGISINDGGSIFQSFSFGGDEKNYGQLGGDWGNWGGWGWDGGDDHHHHHDGGDGGCGPGVTPEPGTLLLMTSGLVFALGISRRRK